MYSFVMTNVMKKKHQQFQLMTQQKILRVKIAFAQFTLQKLVSRDIQIKHPCMLVFAGRFNSVNLFFTNVRVLLSIFRKVMWVYRLPFWQTWDN